MMALLSKFYRDCSGVTAIEYGLIAGLISVVVLTVLSRVGTKLNVKFTSINNALN